MIQHICDHIGCKNIVDGEEVEYLRVRKREILCREHRQPCICTQLSEYGIPNPDCPIHGSLPPITIDQIKRYDGEGNPPPIP